MSIAGARSGQNAEIEREREKVIEILGGTTSFYLCGK
jgi:hypothetical protein